MVKRIKVPMTEPPEALSELESERVAFWARAQYLGLTSLEIRELEAECLDWHRANGRQRVEWVATVRNWIRKEMRFRRERSRVKVQERPQMRISEGAPRLLMDLADRIGRRA